MERLEGRTLLTGLNLTAVSDLNVVGNELYFLANVVGEGKQLFRSDGSREGTTRLAQVGGVNSEANLTEVNGSFYFIDSGQLAVWRDDSSTTGFVRLDGIPHVNGGRFEIIREMVNFGGTLFFAADDGEHGVELWKTDGTNEGTVLVRDVVPGPEGSEIREMTVVGDSLYFSVRGQLLDGVWKTDGTDEGTTRVVAIDYPDQLLGVGDELFFRTYGHSHFSKLPGLYSWNGTEAKCVLIATHFGTEVPAMIAVGEVVYLAANDYGSASGPTRLWKTDGTSDGTLLVQDSTPLSEMAIRPDDFYDLDGTLLFFAGPDHDRRLWRSDGTEGGTYPIDSALRGRWPRTNSFNFAKLDGVAYFSAYSPETGYELWRTDGSVEGTHLVSDLTAGDIDSRPADLVVFRDRLYFSASQVGIHGTLFVSDGTEAGTTRIFCPQGSDTPALFVPQTAQILSTSYLRQGTADEVRQHDITFGSLVPLVGEYGGDFKDRLVFFDSATSVFHLLDDSGYVTEMIQFGPAGAGWLPLVGDWDGDGLETFGLFDPIHSVFFVRNDFGPGDADVVVAYGPTGSGWLPLVGDWNASGHDTLGVFDPQSSVFYFRNNMTPGPADTVVQFGPAGSGWAPLVGDWNGSGHDTPGLYDAAASQFYLRNKLEPGFADSTATFGAAGSGWLPVVGDWDGRTVTPPAPGSGSGSVTGTGVVPVGGFSVPGIITRLESALEAEDHHVTKRNGVTDLTDDQLFSIVDAAIARWAAAGAGAELLEGLRSIEFDIVDWNRNYLVAYGKVDRDAAGWGWYVDPTPLVDEEFEFEERHLYGATVELVAKRYDLLSAVIQYLGRELGIVAELDNSDVMGTVLPKGVRRLPDAAVVDRLLGESG